MAAAAFDLYEVLNVPRSASPGSIRRAYRLQALATHPDKGGKSDIFRSVVLAYETLGSEAGRAAYDMKTQPQTAMVEGESNIKSLSKAQTWDVAGHCRNKQRQSECSMRSASVRLSEPPVNAHRVPKERKQCSLEGRLTAALEMLRRFLADQDHLMRGDLLAQLSCTSRTALCKYMETWKASSEWMVDLSALADGGTDSCSSTDSESQSSDESGARCTSTWEMLCDGGVHFETTAGAAGNILEPLPIEDKTNMEKCNVLLNRASPNIENSDTASATMKSKRTQYRSSHGPVGIITYRNHTGKIYYGARTSVATLWIKSRAQASLEDAVSAHMVLVQVRDAFRDVLNRHGGSLALLLQEQTQVVVQELQEAAEGALMEHGVSGVPGFCSYSAKVSVRPYLGIPLQTPQTRSVATCIEHRQRLFQARSRGWDALRTSFLEVSTQNIEARIPGSHGPLSASRSQQDVAEQLDAAYERYATKRAAVEERIANRYRSKALREEERRAALQFRLIRRMRRMSQIIDNAIQARAAKKRKEANEDLKRRRKEHIAEELKQERENSQKRRTRWAWHHQRDLTMEDILRGPPSEC